MAEPRVRNRLKARTDSLHQALHRDHLLSKLTRGDVSQTDYASALRAFFGFFHTVETNRIRLSCWPEYALESHLSALRQDVSGAAPCLEDTVFTNATEVFGGLYVAHGSMFGRIAMREKVIVRFPYASHQFLLLQECSEVWKCLCHDLETVGASPAEFSTFLSGSLRGFRTMQAFVAMVKLDPANPATGAVPCLKATDVQQRDS